MRAMVLMVGMVGCGGGADTSGEPTARRAVHARINMDNPQACVGCHATIVREWEESMHARAHHDKDPIYGAMRALRMDKQGEDVAKKCAVCHTPRDPSDDTSAKAQTGVSCATCHDVDSVGEGMGAKALQFRGDGILLGPSDLEMGASPVHGTGPAPEHMKDGKSLCLACHDATTTPAGEPACTTGPEFGASATDQTCVSCHMPLVDEPSGSVDRDGKHRQHIFRGPHRAWYQDDLSHLEQAVGLSAFLEDDKLVITLSNQSGHGFPTGFPGRMALVAAVGKDAGGQEVWKAWGKDPMAERPDAVLNKVYVDDEDKPVMPPFSTRLKRDSRLKPDEVRTLRWEVPSAVQEVDVKLLFRLLPPKAAEALQLADAPEAAPKTIGRVTARRGSTP